LPKDIQYFGDNVHYTNQGARLIAFNFAQYILNHRSLESNFLDVPF
jgi:hypothetical protein